MAKEKTSCYGGCAGLKREATGFFRLDSIGSKRCLIDPEGHAFLLLGVNHVNSAALRHTDNIHIWKERYGGSMRRWIEKGVVEPLRDWGFNTVGWTQELVSGLWGEPGAVYQHSRPWPHVYFQWAAMPYVYTIQFADIERWSPIARYPDVFSDDYERWCDYLAREYCSLMAEDPYLIGYCFCAMPGFYQSDFPDVKTWASGLDLEDAADRRKLAETVKRYYVVASEAIRRYDTNHLILGDRYDGNHFLPEYLLETATPYIDAVSINQNGTFEQVSKSVETAVRATGRPVYLADSTFLAPTELLKPGPGSPIYCPDQKARGLAYQRFAEAALTSRDIIGWSWCGYIENRIRKSGIRDYMDEPYTDCVDRMKEFNQGVYGLVFG